MRGEYSMEIGGGIVGYQSQCMANYESVEEKYKKISVLVKEL